MENVSTYEGEMKLYDKYIRFKDWAGEKINGTSLNVDLVNYCSLHCHSCALGSIGVKRKGQMPFEKFVKILDKAQSETKIRHLQAYMYSDAALHPELDRFIAECSKRKIKTWLSTMGEATKCDWAKVIEARPTEMRISMSGWENMSYYQTGSNPDVFDKNFAYLMTLPRYKETTWSLLFQWYRTNDHEYERAEKLAKDNNLKFVPIKAIFMPLEKFVDQTYTKQDREIISHMWESPEEAAKTMKRSKSCLNWKQVAIDANGDVFLCQLVFEDRFKLVNYLDYPLKEIKKMMREHDFCDKCLKCGANELQFCYSEITKSKDPQGEADKKRRLH